MSTNSVRDGRIVRQRDLTTDYTLTLTSVDDGQLLLSNNMKSINVIDDIGNALLRKVDHWDDMPDLSKAALSISMGYLGRTVAYTGETKTVGSNTFEKGCLYKCIPDPAYSWTPLVTGMSAQLLKCEESVVVSSMNSDDYLLISNVDKNARCIIYYDLDENSNPVLKMAMGAKTIAEAKTKTSIIVYRLSSGKWNRTNDLNEYTCIFNNCSVTHSTDNLGMLFKGHIDSAADPSPAFHWELITNDEVQIASPYETVYPIDNTCFLSGIPSCFQFSQVSSSGDSFIITLDSSDLSVGQYYNNNVIYFETLAGLNLSFEGKAGNISKTVEMTGDSANESGKFRVNIEVTPDGSMIADVKRLGDATVTAETTPVNTLMMAGNRTYYYGIKVQLTDNNEVEVESPIVTKVVMTRSKDSNGNDVESIRALSSDEDFASLPCHSFRRCVVKDFTNSIPAYYLYPSNSIYKADGKTYADLTGEDGDVAVQIKKCYLRITKPSGSSSSLDTGILYYLISSTTIPNPPDDSIVIFNDVHPLFRVGGTVLDGQYETEYDPETGTRIATTSPLRSIRNSMYIGAFASVRCYQGTDNLLPKTLRAFANETTAEEKYVTASDTRGNYSDIANYPKMKSGIPCGVVNSNSAKDYNIKRITRQNTQARSVAPYRDGDLVYVGIPGVKISITSDNPTKPTDFPGGCDIEFCGSAERDYKYRLTTDSCIQEKKPYYTRSGSGTSSDPYKYTKAVVAIGDPIPSDTYYNRYFVPKVTDIYSYKKTDIDGTGGVSVTTFTLTFLGSGNTGIWQLKRNSTILAESSSCTVDDAFSFNLLSWEWTNPGATVTMRSIDSVYKLYYGPANYGTRDLSFNWQSQSLWDDAMAGNPNWALNYRPIVDLPRAEYQVLHGNGYSTALNEYYAYTQLTADSLRSDLSAISFANGGTTSTFKFSRNGISKNCVTGNASNVWYSLTSQNSEDANYRLVWNPEYEGWTYTDAYNNVASMDTSVGVPYEAYSKTSDTTVMANKRYFLRDSTDVGPDYVYTEATDITIGDGTTWYSQTSDTHFMNGKDYYTRTGSGTSSDPYRYSKATVTVGGVVSGTYYEQYCFYEVNAPSVIDCQFVNGLYKYIDFYDPGFNRNEAYVGETDSGNYGLTLGTWINYDTGLTHSGDKFAMSYFYREASIEYTLSFDHPTMRWKIAHQEPSGASYIYQSNRINPSTFIWAGSNFAAVSDKAYFYQTNYLRDVLASSSNKTINIGLIPGITEGAATKQFEYTNASDNVYLRKWTKKTEPGASTQTYIKLEYINSNDARLIAAGGSIGSLYGDCWALVKYTNNEYGAIDSVVGSDMDVIAALCAKGDNTVFVHGLFRPINPEDRNIQRTYDSETKKSTNNSLVYELVTAAQYEGINLNTTKIQLMYIGDSDENKLPQYISSRTSEYPIDAINNVTASYKNRWVALKFTVSGNVYTLVTDDGTQSATRPFGWTTLGTNVPPSSPYLTFTTILGATDHSGASVINKKAMHFRNTPLIAFKAKSSGRAFTANARWKSFLSLMMVIEYGTYDLYNALSHGKRLINPARTTYYGPITFSGRTVPCGNNTQEIIYDRDVDININGSDFGSTASADRIVALNYRGIENPFGNIGEYDEGIIPVSRYINGTLVKGYYECTDPGAYSDKLSYLTMLRHSFVYASTVTFSPNFYDFQASNEYNWRSYTTPAAGWIKRLYPDTNLPYSIGATAPTTDGSKFISGYWTYNYESMWDANNNGDTFFMLHIPYSIDYNSVYSMGFSYGTPSSKTGARLAY